MNRYKVKQFNSKETNKAIKWYKEWLESRKHIKLIDVKIVNDDLCHIIITYMEVDYVG